MPRALLRRQKSTSPSPVRNLFQVHMSPAPLSLTFLLTALGVPWLLAARPKRRCKEREPPRNVA